MTFATFVGIDWSGAKGKKHRGIQVAACAAGTMAPRLVRPKEGAWSRSAVLDWLTATATSSPTLAGLDFSFSLPFVDEGAYFPGIGDNPRDAPGLWRLVDRVCAAEADLYAGTFAATSPWAAHFFANSAKGVRFARRHKAVERACALQGLGHPESVFHLIGPKQVGRGSLAGMRFLAALRQRLPMVGVWPFDPPQDGRSSVVEVFPRAFLAAAGHGPTKIRSAADLDRALARFGTAPSGLSEAVDDNVSDAVVAAAALRALSADRALWRPASMEDRVRRTEGWIFGVR